MAWSDYPKMTRFSLIVPERGFMVAFVRQQQWGLEMREVNFHQRRRELLRQHRVITDQIERLGRPQNDDEKELSLKLDVEDGCLWDSIRDLEDARLAKPIRSRHDVATRLAIIADREGLALPLRHYIDELVAQIEEWRRSEPVIWSCAGRVNA